MIEYRIEWDLITNPPHPWFGEQFIHHKRTFNNWQKALDGARQLSRDGIENNVKNVKMIKVEETELPSIIFAG